MNIELLTLAEIADVQGQKGNFTVRIKKHPRYVDTEKCIACGICAEKCPKKVDDEFNMGLSKRKAAYIQYGQTVPLKYAIDDKHCIYFTKGKCRACEKFCPTGAINFEDQEQELSLNVGSLILAPGFKAFDPTGLDIYGYDHIPDVVTSLEYERLLSSSGPCMGHLERPSDHKEPGKIAWIQCVGSRNTNRCSNGYCSSVCCMYAIKQAQVTAEHLQQESPKQSIFFMDLRTHGKEFERYLQQACSQGIEFIRSRPHTIMPGPRNQGAVLQYVLEDGSLQEEYFDMVVLSVGLEPSPEAQNLADLLGFDLDHYGFAATAQSSPVSSSREGVFVTGAFESPMSIPRAVTQASTAATESAKALLPAKNTLTKDKTYPQEMDISQEEPRIGVFVCSCGINIAGVVDVEDIAAYARSLPHVELVENNMFTCSTDTQDLIAQRIKENRLNRIVIAACTPRTHEPLFQDTLKEAGLNGYLVEMANIRNQNAWVHQKQKEQATAKAKDQVRMAVAKISRSQPLSELEVNVVQKALVIGGGVAGMTAALELAELGYPVLLLEKSGQLGGNALHLYHSGWEQDMQDWVKGLIQDVLEHSNIEVLTNAALVSSQGSVGSFQSQVQIGNETRTVDYGVAVLATGAKEYKPKDLFLYGQDKRVLTHLEFDQLRRQDPEQSKQAQSVAFIQCVGSRNQERMYCSRICCTHTMHSAIALKEEDPQKQVYVLYRDIRTYALHEDLYTKARSLGVIFIRYDLENQPQVQTAEEGLQIVVQDPILQQDIQLHVSCLVLASAIIPQENTDLVELYKCGLNQDGFLNEAHPKLRPVDMGVDGLFVAGLCNYPKNMNESISQAKAAASRAGVLLSKSVMKLDAIKSYVTDNCDGCALCLDVCPYQAISLQSATNQDGSEHRKIEINKALCKGCGLCEATCPKDGVYVHGFTLDQLRSQVDALLAE